MKWIYCFVLSFLLVSSAHAKECVVLLHGLVRTHYSMLKIENRLAKAGYLVVNEDYPSRTQSIPELANHYLPHFVDQCRAKHAKKIHFVTHSLGGLLVRYYLEHHHMPKNTRVVMLAPPNKGSAIATLFENNPVFQHIAGPVGHDMAQAHHSVVTRLQQYYAHEVGVIGGTLNLNLLSAYFLEGPNDGRVLLANTKLAGMKDFVALPVTHTFIVLSNQVIENIQSFLSRGQFLHDSVA